MQLLVCTGKEQRFVVRYGQKVGKLLKFTRIYVLTKGTLLSLVEMFTRIEMCKKVCKLLQMQSVWDIS
jgi:hypothetical protein